MSTRGIWVASLVLAASLFACPFPPGPGGGGDGDGDADATQADIDEYNALTLQLDEARQEFGGEHIDEMYPAGNVIYWLEFPDTWDPVVHSLDTDTGASVEYTAMPITGDNYFIVVSDVAVAYAEVAGETNIYHVYRSTDGQEITTVTVAAPGDEQQYWAYALSGTDLYHIETASDQSPGTKLFRTSAGGQPELLTTLEEAGCENVGEFAAFGVSGGTLIFIEQSRLWRFDLPSLQATFLDNVTEISWGTTVYFEDDGILFTSATGPFFYEYETGEMLDVGALIEAADYRINQTFASAHLFSQDITRWRDYFIYVGNSGLFAYDLVSGGITPLLLNPRQYETSDLRVDYRYPVVLDNGTLFVNALESESGAVGADGPIYQLDLGSILP